MPSFLDYLYKPASQRLAEQRQGALEDTLSRLREGFIGQRGEGPPTLFGEVPVEGGAFPATDPRAQFVSSLLQPATADIGIKSALDLLEQQRQAELAQSQLAQQQQQQAGLAQALQSPAIQATPEGQALASLIGAGATKEQVAAFKPQLEPFTLGTGQQRFTGTGEAIAIAPEKAEDLRTKQAQLFGQATTLRKEFTGVTKEYAGQNAAYGRVIASAEDPSAAGDLALIFNFMKILDPGSTVREGEFATAQNAAGVPQRVMALYNNVARGERMTVIQRNDFIDRAGKLFESASEQHKKTSEEFRKLAIRQNIDPRNVVFQRQLIEVQPGIVPPPPPPGFR